VPPSRISFRNIIAPMEPSKFIERFHEKRPLHLKDQPKKFESLFGWDRLNRLLNSTPLWDAPRLRLVKENRPIPPHTFSRPAADETAGNVLRAVPGQVSELLAQGATINLNEIEKLDENLAAVSKAFAMTFNCRSNCNLYLSRKDVIAFASHFDPTDVFILHIAGKKRWRVYDKPFEAPAYVEGYQQSSFPEEYHEANKGGVLLQPTLNPGDVLYIPAGYYHDAMALTDTSLHLTFSIELVRGLVVAEILEPLLASDPLFRRPLPDPDNAAAHDAHIKAMAERMAERLVDPQVTEHIRARQKNQAFWDIPKYTLPDAELEQVFRVKTLNIDVRPTADGGTLNVQGTKHALKPEYWAIASWMLSGDSFTTGDLLAEHKDTSRDTIQAVLDIVVSSGAVESIDPFIN
jgi:bifunctional lysine-specific demethylase and histidyl-hydroxylase MINA